MATSVSVSNLVSLPTYMAVKRARRAQVTVKKAVSWLEPRFVASAVSRAQAGVHDLTFKEGFLAFGHAAIVTFGSLSDIFLEYAQERTNPALVVSAVQKDKRITSLEQEIVTGRIQATLVLAVVYQELHRHMSLREPSAQDTVRDDSPSLIIGNPLYTEAATLSTYASSSAKAQPVPDEASLSTDQPPTNTLFTENELCDSLPLAIADELHNPSSSSPDLPDSAQPLVISTHVTSDSVTSPGPQGVPREPSPTPHLSAPQNLRAMMVSVPHHRDPSVPAADPGSPVDFNSADTQMGWGGQTIQDDTHHDSQAPTHPDNSESFGSFLFHDMSNNQSASDRSDSRDSFTSTSASSPRSTLPALQCPVQKLPLLSNRNPVSDVNLAHSPVPDTSSRALQKSSQTTSMHSPQTAQTQALTTQTSARSNRRKPRQPQQQQSFQMARVQKVPAATAGAASSGAANSPAPGLRRRPKKSPTPPKLPIWK